MPSGRINELWQRLRALAKPKQLDRDLEDEVAFHLAMREEKNRAAGLPAEEAQNAARRQFGNTTRVKEHSRGMWTFVSLETLWQDVRYGARVLAKSPGFTVVAIITLALGIGASTAIFSVVNSVLLRPLPYDHPDRLVQVWESNSRNGPANTRNVVNPVNFLEWRDHNHAFVSMAAVVDDSVKVNYFGGEPLRVPAIQVSPQFFSVLGVAPILGRAFIDDEGILGHDHSLILSYEYWQQQFGGSRDVLNKPIEVDDEPATIVGVMPRGFSLPNLPGSVWKPLALERSKNFQDGRYMSVVARLKPGITLAQAQQDMERVAQWTREARPNMNTGWGAIVLPMLEDATREVRTPLLVLLSAVGFVLLIACANVANLLLMRGTRRGREMAVRTALGAARIRILQQLFIESLLLAGAGTLGGLAIARWGLRGLLNLIPAADPLPRMESIRMDGGVFLFALALAFCTTVLFGLLPAIRLSRVNLQDTLKQGSARTGVGGNRALRQCLVVAEVALALLLSIGAGLLLRSFQRLTAVNLGFEPERVVTMRVFASPSKYGDDRKRSQYLENILREIRNTPGVQSAGSVHFLPLMDRISGSCFAVGTAPVVNEGTAPDSQFLVVSPGYFDAMGTPLLKGRDLGESDSFGTPSVVVVNHAFVEKFFPDGDALGKQLSVCWSVPNPVRIVGVVADARQTRLQDPPAATIFVANAQGPMYVATLVVRAKSDPRQIVRAVDVAVHHVDPDQALSEVQTMEHVFSDSASDARFQLVLLMIFAGLAVALAMIGVYGVVSYSVGQRTQEIGIRMAMGAEASTIAGMVLREAFLLAGLAVAIGLGGAFALTRVMEALLYETTPTDPATLAEVSVTVLSVAALAALLPARRAMRVDPMVALRYE
jgi:putative ABC transport system permease protein